MDDVILVQYPFTEITAVSELVIMVEHDSGVNKLKGHFVIHSLIPNQNLDI